MVCKENPISDFAAGKTGSVMERPAAKLLFHSGPSTQTVSLKDICELISITLFAI